MSLSVYGVKVACHGFNLCFQFAATPAVAIIGRLGLACKFFKVRRKHTEVFLNNVVLLSLEDQLQHEMMSGNIVSCYEVFLS